MCNVKLLTVAIATALINLSPLNTALAAEPTMEKCYGVAKGGKNDCGAKGRNSCAGQIKQDADPHAWIFVPKGVCHKIVGGTLESD